MLFNNKLQKLVNKISEDNLKTYADFFFSTFFHHYKLYQYVFTKVQDKLQVLVDVELDTPIPPLPLKDGKHISIYEYEQEIHEIEEREHTAKEHQHEELEIIHKKDEIAMKEIEKKVEEIPMPWERKVCTECFFFRSYCERQSLARKVMARIHQY